MSEQQEKPVVTQAAESVVSQLFGDLRSRKFLSYLFATEPESRGTYGYVDSPLDLSVQSEIAEAWTGIVRDAIGRLASRTDEPGGCDLCAGDCRGHPLDHPDRWEPEPGSRAHAALSTQEPTRDASEWELEQAAFYAANRSDVPTDVREVIKSLWREVCARPAASPGDEMREAERAILNFVAGEPEDAQQLSAVQFIHNRADCIASAVLAALSSSPIEDGLERLREKTS